MAITNLLHPTKLFSSVRWRTRLTIWTFAAIAGVAAVGFTRLSDLALAGFSRVTDGRLWLTLLLTPGLGMIVVWATTRHFPGAQGSGIPQTIAATRALRLHEPVSRLLSLRIAVGKVFLGALALFAGFSAGREGPTVQICAIFMLLAHRWLPNQRVIRAPDLVIAGGAAGIAAAFNTPLAGIVFAIEELARRFEARTSAVLLSTIIVSGLTAIAFEGNYRYFGKLIVGSVGVAVIPAVLVGGVVCGLIGGGFSHLMLLPQRQGHTPFWQMRKRHPVWFAGACGLLVALIGIASSGLSLGSGYSITAAAIDGQVHLPWYTPIARYAATAISYFSGIPGGLFAPSLAVGASIGFDLAKWLPFGIGAHPVVAICMAGFLAAVTQSPITSAIIVMEMVGGHAMVISLMTAALLSKAISERFGPELYPELSRSFDARPRE